jgi:hypothetical protein
MRARNRFSHVQVLDVKGVDRCPRPLMCAPSLANPMVKPMVMTRSLSGRHPKHSEVFALSPFPSSQIVVKCKVEVANTR